MTETGLNITDASELQSPFDDMRAQFVGTGAFEPHVIDLFPNFLEFRKTLDKNVMVQLADELFEGIEANRKAAVVNGSTDILHTAEKEATEKARAVAMKRGPPKKDIRVPLELRTT